MPGVTWREILGNQPFFLKPLHDWGPVTIKNVLIVEWGVFEGWEHPAAGEVSLSFDDFADFGGEGEFAADSGFGGCGFGELGGDRLVEVDIVLFDAVPFQPSGLFVSASGAETKVNVGVVVRGLELEGLEDGVAFFGGEGLDFGFSLFGKVPIVFLEWVGGGSFGADCPVIAGDRAFDKSATGFGRTVLFEPVNEVLSGGAVNGELL